MQDIIKCIALCLLEFGSCKLGWKEFGQFCYQFNFDQKNWAAARLECQKRGGELTSINSPVEQAHISLEVGEFGIGKYAWIGKLILPCNQRHLTVLVIISSIVLG